MEPFTRVTAVGLPIDLPNVDTDRVIPARFLRKDRSVPEYARYCFTTCASTPTAPSARSSS